MNVLIIYLKILKYNCNIKKIVNLDKQTHLWIVVKYLYILVSDE